MSNSLSEILSPKHGKPIKADRYPGLSQEDTALARAFFADRGGQYTEAFFDWPIGTDMVKIDPAMEEPYRSMSLRSGALRMDAVCIPTNGGPWHLIEFRANGGIGAIGSLMSYKILWPKEAKPDPKLILVTDYLRETIRVICKAYKIEAYQYKVK